MTHVDLSRVDWALLRKQKFELVETIAAINGHPARRGYLTGLLHLLDYLQDARECVRDDAN